MSIFEKAMRQLNDARRAPKARPAPQADRTASARRYPFAKG
jgi:hypothetical protein